ncbi:MAG: valine--tRNA ligase [Bacteroidetes bacterium]|uniref:Valine--tRNA ligase n=1 Tax=Phaeocystidibacter marisrubri TaxID=1577780 RepID=A0A6L3ZHF4_9FLAO|nr:valine--tRNA ligase [Phaeocystidibacter marisrubri]KAB2817257.1 valine--tRNA ligase [Phaeocystidibacter marisrubri]TNE27718.1 MAG: valine--tRNA ligase [Bacteroidota bacterium]GGH76218.1 valine--tRNA ligase [Phaeocystidibacter marisrubri]
MEIPAKYDPTSIEDKWYAYWMKNNFFRSVPDEREPYTIVIPPPNVTGVLHMGHMLNNTIQDVLVRRARMRGLNACWVPGTDHASIATEAKVVQKLRAEGIKKSDLSREEFLEHAWDWTHKHGGIILSQLKKLGASCDWEREAFTMDEARSESVLQVFADLYEKGHIYRGNRMVNWDPEAKTTVSDEEVIHKDVNAKLYYLKYFIEGTEEYVVVATTRPETIMGDTAVCVNPKDERYTKLKGKKLIVPVVGRAVPVIEDDYVDLEFGTGCLKVTPAHDVNDYEIGQRHQLDTIDIFHADGTLNENGLHYEGQDRFVVRKAIYKELEEKGLLEKVEDYNTSVGTSERTGAVIEPRLSLQWFLRMSEISEPALKAVMDDEVKLIPEKFKNTYRHWMENVRDWNISRQLWWGHQIPAYYYGEGADDFVVALSEEEAIAKATEKAGRAITATDLTQDPDVLDTWFSSWLWPISVFDGIRNPENEEIQYYYPTNDLVTAPEILFFWVARMILAGYEYKGKKPFSNVYLTGIVRDKLGRKMSKSLGNSPDPIDLMAKYGADGVRVGMLLTSPAGNDLPFDEELCVQGRNFSNKIWNAFRLVKGWEVSESAPDAAGEAAVEWFGERLKQATAEINDSFSKYRISDALMSTYKLVWDDFCSWYLELVKPAYQQPISKTTLNSTIGYFEELLKLLHPFMPFLTEELWQLMTERKDGETIMYAPWPSEGEVNETALTSFQHAQEVISGIRNIRKEKNISPKEPLELVSTSDDSPAYLPFITKLGHISEFVQAKEKPEQAFAFRAGTSEYHIPVSDAIDIEAEIEKLNKDLDYQKGFLVSVNKKLSNERFVNNAPEQVIANERKKLADAEAKISLIEERLTALKG